MRRSPFAFAFTFALALAFVFALAFAFAFAGCGFLGQAPFGERELPDVAPWQDIGPVTFCDGARRIGIPDEGPLGTCTSQPAAACAADSDCASRETCLCGACVRAVCEAADQCRASQVCTFAEHVCDRACATDSDCAGGESCVPGQSVCRGTCAQTSDCQSGERCDLASGFCKPLPCADASVCGGRSCTLQRIPAALAEPSPLVEGAGLTMWLERTDPGGVPQIWRATSTDGLTFTFDPDAPLLAGRAPSVVRLPDGYQLAYDDGKDVVLTSASDGISFPPGGLLVPEATQPSLVAGGVGGNQPGGYGVRGGSIWMQAGLDPAREVLTPSQVADPVLWQGVDALVSPFVESLTDAHGQPFFRLWFAAHGTGTGPSSQFGTSIPTPPNWSIGEAASYDGLTFTPWPFDPVFDRTLDFTKHPSELDPAVVTLGDQHLLYYRRAAADGTHTENLAVARNPPR